MLCAAPSAARALQTFEPPRTEPEHTVRRAFPEHGVLRIEDLPHVPYPLPHLAAQELRGPPLPAPYPLPHLAAQELTGTRHSGKKKGRLTPP